MDVTVVDDEVHVQETAQSDADDEDETTRVEDVVRSVGAEAGEASALIEESDIADILNMIEETDTDDSIRNLSELQRSIMKCLGLRA